MPNYITILKAKKTTDKHPDLNGFIKINEALAPGEYQVGLYVGTSQSGNKKYSGTIKPKFEKKESPAEHWQEKVEKTEAEDEVSF